MTSGPATASDPVSRVSSALDNLRGFVIIMVVTFHAVTAYMASQPAVPSRFSDPPFEWLAHPIVDADRWLGFDLFGAFVFLHLMQLMFFLSGLFVVPAMIRKRAGTFLRDRVLRLGVPFLVGAFVLMPVAYFPAYRVTATDPSWSAFWSQWTALPFWPAGPNWFLWLVLVLNLVALGIFQIAPRAVKQLGYLAARAAAHPERFLLCLAAVSALIYLPLAMRFEPWQWLELGPFAIQPSLAPQYAIYFVAGLAVGASDLGRGLLGAEGMLARRWAIWVAGASAAFVMWLVPAALIVKGHAALPGLRIARELAFVLFAACACFAWIAMTLRFAAERWRTLGGISDNAYGIYLFHYVFLVWTQYALLPYAMPALVKGAIVLCVTLGLSWAVSAGIGRVPLGARMLRGTRRVSIAARDRSAAKTLSAQLGLSD
jgi:peptidoglycan/LPS O-acetylase OafA/YrhL